MKSSLKYAADAEISRGHPWIIVPKKDQPKPHPQDYFVPNFGRDPDIIASENSLGVAEEQLKHKWDFQFTEKKKNEVVPFHMGPHVMDDDIASTLAHATSAEKALNHPWDVLKDM